jgi:hypothetical protein
MEMKWGQHQSTKKAHEKNLQRIERNKSHKLTKTH